MGKRRGAVPTESSLALLARRRDALKEGSAARSRGDLQESNPYKALPPKHKDRWLCGSWDAGWVQTTESWWKKEDR